MIRLAIACLLAFIASAAQAAGNNFYVCGSAATCNSGSSGWSSGSDSNNCTSKATPCATTAGVLAKLGSGDIANYGNGSYSTPSCSLVYGSATNGYTTIKAEQVGGVNMSGLSCDYSSGSRAYYWKYEGVVFDGAFLISYGDHVKLINVGSSNTGDGRASNIAFGKGSSYMLCEGCYAWGDGRYKFLAWAASNVIFRRCVGRMDVENTIDQNMAGMAVYNVTNGLVQNTIIIDSNQDAYYNDNGRGISGCMHLPVTSGPSTDITITTSMCLHSTLGGIEGEDATGNTRPTVTNVVLWDVTEQGEWVNYTRGDYPSWTNTTNGVSSGGSYYHSGYNQSSATMRNNLFYNTNGTSGFQQYWDSYIPGHDYNAFYGVTGGLPTIAAHEYTNRNPIWNASTNPSGALKYITRIEAGSNLSGIGYGGADIGANLVYMVGAPGTLWGETGYNTVQSTPMWPFPNEAVIKAKMGAYDYGGLSGARGFAAAGNGLYGGPITLTSYIWEALGNACPPDICTYGQSNPTINSVSCTQTSYTQSPGGIPCTASVTGTVTSWSWSLQTPDANCSFSAQTQSPTLTCAYGGTRKPCVTVQPGGASACAASSYGWRYAKPSSLQVN